MSGIMSGRPATMEERRAARLAKIKEARAKEAKYAKCEHGIGGPHQHGHSMCPGPTVTPKQRLVAHVRDFHRRPPSGMTYRELGAWHAGQHHRYSPDHYHAGPNTGPGDRPPGWRTGEDMVPNVENQSVIRVEENQS